ncbi:LysR family transcriptional regulator [Gluconobacter sp. Dm-73]|uniref:LysR family transcriptional regulator n=1 Tax=Gluconobacter sp. Dm-73 TaxID=2799802 RepID=UPI001B8AEA7C|nr:LysR family transcriptional regulator [Gluconobacter sp. Dm-73]MBS1076101.1 LysR family transcriptional regulator [Gluconobacter sp. Dm-73]
MHLSRGDLGDLNLFCAIAKTGGFRKTAAELDLSPSALSHAIRGLEKRLGVRLFNRTNRSVTLTPAGRELLSHVTSGLSEITNGLEALNRYRDRPAGQLRLNVPTDAARLILAPVIARYVALYPEVRLEVAVDDVVEDIIEQGFDAGVRYGGTIPEDMIAVPLCPDLRWVTVASPAYLASAPPLRGPADLHQHRCIGIRMGSGKIYHWELERGEEKVFLDTDWSVIVNETVLSIEIAERDGGISYNLESRAAVQIANGSLVKVLPEWASMGPPLFLYYPSRRQLPEALRALIRLVQEQKAVYSIPGEQE